MTTQSTPAPGLPELPKPAVPSEPIMKADSNRSAARGDYYQDGVTPPYFTADQMNAHYLKGYEAGSAAAAQAAWQPIATAPQTGRTLLLGYFNVLGKWRTLRGQWFSDAVIQEEWTNSDVHEAGWFETSVECDDEDNGCWPTDPTHWMPLPAAPTQGADGAAPQAVVGEASEVKRLLDVHAVSMTMGGRQILHSAIDRLAALTPSPTPKAPQETDALREALIVEMRSQINHLVNDLCDLTIDEFGLLRYVPEPSLMFHNMVAALVRWSERAALAQHQPQQGEGA